MSENSASGRSSGSLNIILIVGIIVALLAGYLAGGLGKIAESEYKALQQNYNTIQQKNEALTANLTIYAKKIKVAFIYVGPIGDYGWSHAHDVGRKYVQGLFPWVDTIYVESVSAADAPGVIDGLINQQKVDVVFTTSFDFMDQTVQEAQKYPDKLFFHCSGFKREKNLGTYFADFYPIYFLNGLMAGALTLFSSTI